MDSKMFKEHLPYINTTKLDNFKQWNMFKYTWVNFKQNSEKYPAFRKL